MRPEPGRRNSRQDIGRGSSANNRKRKTSRNPRRRVRRPNAVANRRRKRKFNEALGKFIPVFVAIVAIVALVAGFYGNKLLERYRYSGIN